MTDVQAIADKIVENVEQGHYWEASVGPVNGSWLALPGPYSD